MKLHRYVDHQRLHIVTKDVISLSISVLLLFRHYISHKITFGAPSSGGVLRSACGAFIYILTASLQTKNFNLKIKKKTLKYNMHCDPLMHIVCAARFTVREIALWLQMKRLCEKQILLN